MKRLLPSAAFLVVVGAAFAGGFAASAEKAPDSCLVAIMKADEAFAHTSAANRAAVRGDTPKVNRHVAALNILGPEYNEAKDECKGN